MIRRYRQTGWDIVASVLLFVCIVVAATVLLLEANGYLIDFARLRVEPSSLLVLRTEPWDVTLDLDGATLAQAWDGTWQIAPGRHELAVSAENRHIWRQSFHVVPRRAAVYQSIILYRITPTLIETRPVHEEERGIPLVDPSLRVTVGGEIRIVDGLQTRLVTRFSRAPSAVRLLDAGHLIMQLDREIHVIDSDGSNDRVLFKLPDETARQLIISEGGRSLGIVNGEEVAIYQLY